MLAAIAFLVYQYYDVFDDSFSSNNLNITLSINLEVMWNYGIKCVSAFERKPHNWRSSSEPDDAVLSFRGLKILKSFDMYFIKWLVLTELLAIFA